MSEACSMGGSVMLHHLAIVDPEDGEWHPDSPLVPRLRHAGLDRDQARPEGVALPRADLEGRRGPAALRVAIFLGLGSGIREGEDMHSGGRVD